MAAVSSWHLIRRTPDHALFRTSLRIGVVTAAVAITFVQGFGFAQFGPVSAVQPTKLGSDTPQAEALVAEWTARFGPGDYLPPVLADVGLGFMILIGFALGLLWLLVPLLWRDWIIRLRFPLWLLLLLLPLPFVALILGWISREVGRQPWVAYGLLRVDPAVSPISPWLMGASLLFFTLLLGTLAVTNWVLMARHAARGAADPALGRAPAQPSADDDNRPEPAFA
ncbi:cytochrome ubiquinol oxidase subunit I [Micromonospora craniellae]|uniref:cytochrome ubiquinol oxidase subunit I n=1 Tax=Micromonospora craniellae TaxID=2294034 RepID=UPI001CC6EB6E